MLGPVSELFTNALLIFVFDVIAEALLGISGLWVETKCLLVASNFAGDVPFDSESVAIHVVETGWGVAINLDKSKEDITLVALAHTILAGASFDLLLLIWFAEALLCHSSGWITELSIVALDGTFDLTRIETIVTHFDVAEWHIIEWTCLATIENSSTALAFVPFFLSATLHWVWWLVNWIGLAETLLLVSIIGITIKGSLSAHHVTVR